MHNMDLQRRLGLAVNYTTMQVLNKTKIMVKNFVTKGAYV